MRILPLTLGVLCSLTACRSTPAIWSVDRTHPDTLRTVQQGQVLGGEGRYGSHAWLGLPFARPPVGERRWKKPEAPEAWTGVREALKFGAACPQPGGVFFGGKPGEVVGSEDCLTLNLWAPRFTPQTVPTGEKKLPVMVWIHGGGNSIGSASFYDGGHLATEQQVLVVSVQYRLGPLGWLRHPTLRAGADETDASGNFGTLDLIRSLDWVRDNAAAFGGDPKNVTIFGESAGGLNVYTLLLAPKAKGLFHRAIIESGGFWTSPIERAERFQSEDPEAHRNSSNEVLARLLVSEQHATDAADARAQLQRLPAEELASWLRGRSPKALLDAYSGGRSGMLDAPLVFADGVVLPAGEWLERFSAGDWNRVPVLVGSNHDEMKLFLFLDPQRVHRFLGLFPRFTDEPLYLGTADTMSRFWKLNGVDRPVEAMLQSGATDVYAYRFDWHDEPTVGGADLSRMLGAAHGVEIPFVFGHFQMGALNALFDERHAAGRELVSAAMRQYWGQFARAGAPGKGSASAQPQWAPVSLEPNAATHLLFDIAANGGMRMDRTLEDQATILGDLFKDPRLDGKQRCGVLHELVTWHRGLTRADYDATEACKGFAFEGFPWK